MPTANDQAAISTYIQAAEHLHQGVMILNQEGNILSVNRRFAQGLGYNKDQFEPKTIFQVNPHFNFISWKKLWEEVVEKGRLVFETEHLTADSETTAVKLELLKLEADGKYFCQARIQEDPTELPEDFYLARFCLDNLHEIIFWVNPDGSIFYANRSALHLLDYSPEELYSLNMSDIDQQLAARDRHQQWKKLKAKKWLQNETLLRCQTGNSTPADLSRYYMNYNGREYEVVVAKDLRQQKKREDLMTLSFHALDQASEMIYWLENDGRFYYFNDTFLEKTGYRKNDLENKTLMDLIPDITPAIFAETWEALRNTKFINTERSLLCKDGTSIPVEGTVTLVELGGKEYTCTTLRDITKHLERQASLQRLNDEKEALNLQLQEENIILKEEIEIKQGLNNIISRSANYKPVLRQIGQVADTDATVLILGETGTGKELVANAIYRLSNRSQQAWVKVNCSALPENLIESELFGHEKGAFTGAFQKKIGRFEMAHRGTIFLDEIGEIPLELQSKLLRVLQEGEFQRLGGSQTIQVDVRVIAATNRKLEERVEKGLFREDLYYRLNVFPIYNIPLRERKDDIPLLVRHFIEKYNHRLGRRIEEIPQPVMKELMEYEYPGNVRELENLIERAIILSPGKQLASHFQFKKTKSGRKKTFIGMEEMQRRHILDALRRAQGKVTGKGGAAELLKMKDKTLYSRMSKLGIGRNDFLK